MTLKKSEYIAKYGEEPYELLLEQGRERYWKNKEKVRAAQLKWKLENKEKVKAYSRDRARKNGKYYEKRREYMRTSIQGERHRTRALHGGQYRPFKMIIAPNSEIHHEWIKKTAEYRGVALVEANPHRYGIIDVIQILDGEITLLTEGDVKNGTKAKEEGIK